MNRFDADVEHRLVALWLQRRHGRREALPVDLALAGPEQLFEPRGLRGVFEADPIGVEAEVVAADDELVQRALRIRTAAAAAVGQLGGVARMPVAVDRRRDAQAQQHALDGFEQGRIGLRQPHADASLLRTLDRTVGVEQATQQAAIEVRRSGFHRRRDGLASRACTQFFHQLAQRTGGHAHLVPARDGPLPAAEVAAVWERGNRGFGRPHDARRAVGNDGHVATGDTQLRRPDRQHGLVGIQCSVADQQPDQIALLLAAGAIPAFEQAVVVQQDLVPGLQFAGRSPLAFEHMARLANDAAHRVVRRQAQRMALPRLQPEHRLGAGGKEALRFGRIGPAVDHREEALAHQ